ncbi:hypothetical protein HDU91_001365 [Kappamyces sp. JEL0680]|nr:hypothetical protein HDU91_001365 [Kappamyces sp. JEL0680]
MALMARWEVPLSSLIPPIPSRLDYILHIQDLLSLRGQDTGPVWGIDLGTGHSCIYPLLGCSANRSWSFLALDVDETSLDYARLNVERNSLQDRIQVQLNDTSSTGAAVSPRVLQRDHYDFLMCNPPFYRDSEQIDAQALFKAKPPHSKCTGTEYEMITPGGEVRFVASLIGRKDDALELERYLVGIGLAQDTTSVLQHRLDSFTNGFTTRWILSWTWTSATSTSTLSLLQDKQDRILAKECRVQRPSSVEQVAETMKEMDRQNKTSFSSWIRSESNISYLCTFKGPMILEYIDQDPASAMFALEWIIDGWSVESVAELVLKLFYAYRISSDVFSQRLFALVHAWPNEKLAELLPIILIGESVVVVSNFFASWLRASGWDVDRMADVVVPIVASFHWNPAQMSEFLMEMVLQVVEDPIVQKSMFMVVHDEIDVALNKMLKASKQLDVLDTFELLLQIIIEERGRVSGTASPPQDSDEDAYIVHWHTHEE